jgi:hypothetical protein
MVQVNPITRTAVLNRWRTVWPYAGVPYSQARLHKPDGYRQDCSGFVCMGVQLPLNYPGSWGGLSTSTMVSSGLWKRLASWDSLKLADAIGIMGPGSDSSGSGRGHVMGFEAWLNGDPNDSRAYIWEQAGSVSGPRRRIVDLAVAARQGYAPFRCSFVVDDGTPVSPGSGGAQLHRRWPSYMPVGHWFGNIAGPVKSHGGYYAQERPDVSAIQSRLNALGYSVAADGKFGPSTISAVTRWQRERYAAQTSLYGQVWPDDWARLFTY